MSTLPSFEYASAKDLNQALSAIGPTWNDSVPYAGGLDLLDLMKERLYEPKRLVNIKAIEDLKFVRSDPDGTVHIGPLVTLSEIASHPELSRFFPAFSRACAKAATVQVRNVATIGGNLCQRPRCWYFRHEEFPCLRKGGSRCFAQDGENRYHAIFTQSEPCVIVNASTPAVGLYALDAQVKIAKAGGTERVIPISKFYVLPKDNVQRETVLEPGELVTEIIIPGAAKNMKQAYLKLQEKQSFDWPLADCAAAATFDNDVVKDIRIVLGSAAPVPHRAGKAESYLTGKALTPETAAEAGRLAVQGAKPLEQNEYKLQLFPVVVRRTLAALVERQGRPANSVEAL